MKLPEGIEIRGLRRQDVEAVAAIETEAFTTPWQESTFEGLLLSCDSIQSYGDYRYNSLLARWIMPWIGFPKTTLVGPRWLKLMTCGCTSTVHMEASSS